MKVLLVIVLLFMVFSPPSVAAQEELKIEAISVTVTPAPETSYALPFPGILPDNPLYALKATRDRVVSFFIADPVKKAEFNLLQADKRLQAGLFLLHKERPDRPLALSTISKGQNYFEEAIVIVSKPEEGNTSLNDLPMKLHTAAKKHHELLQKAQKAVSAEERDEVETLIKRAEGFSKITKQLSDTVNSSK